MEARLDRLEVSIGSSTPQPQPLGRDSISTISETQTATLDLSCSLGAFPASSMTSSNLHDSGLKHGSDFVSRGVITIDVAEGLFSFYQQKLDSNAYHILVDGDSLATIRRRSSLLTAAICTVSAYCSGSQYYRSLLNHLQHEASRELFSSSYQFDDVRALCIGTLWLPDISKALNGLGRLILSSLLATGPWLIFRSSSDCQRVGLAPMHYQIATYKTGMLRSYSSLFSCVFMRPSLLFHSWTTPPYTRRSFSEESARIS